MDSITDIISLVLSNVWLYGGSFLLVLSILVIVHEWGHFAVARACGVRVVAFAVGFGPEIYGYTDPRTGTRWKICWLPIGGYVQMFGDADPAGASQTDQVTGEGQETPRTMTSEERKHAFFTKSVAQRAAIVFAGPAINFLFAILLLSAVYITQGKESFPPVATAIQVGSAAEKAGLQPGDKVVAINGRAMENFDDLSRTVKLALDTPMDLTIERDGKPVQVTAAAKRMEVKDRFGFKHQFGILGVVGGNSAFALNKIAAVDGTATGGDVERARTLLRERLDHGPVRLTMAAEGRDGKVSEVLVSPTAAGNADWQQPGAERHDILVPLASDMRVYRPYGFFMATVEASKQTWAIVRDSLYAFGQMIAGVRSPTELGGVIRIGTLAGDMARAGVLALVTFTAILSINLGLVNLFPIPMLDGGHLLFYGIEAVRRKPVSERVQEYAFRVGLVTLVFLMAFSNLNDVLQLILQ